ncbi:MAG: hypothetical protein Phog2KO_46040 [Phototrophicaceae bacterium]
MYGVAELICQLSPDDLYADLHIENTPTHYLISTTVTSDALIESSKKLPYLIPAILKPTTDKEKKLITQGISITKIAERYIPSNYLGAIIPYIKTFDSKNAKLHSGIWDDTMFPIWHYVYSFAKGSTLTKTYPTLVHLWHAHAICENNSMWLVKNLLETLSNPLNEPNILAHKWNIEVKNNFDYELVLSKLGLEAENGNVRAIQGVSPTTVQGQGTSNYLNRFKEQKPQVFWLELYLAFAGFVQMGIVLRHQKRVIISTPTDLDPVYQILRNAVKNYRKSYQYQLTYNNNNFNNLQIRLLNYLSLLLANGTSAKLRLQVFEYEEITNNIPAGENIFTLHRVFHKLEQEDKHRYLTFLDVVFTMLISTNNRKRDFAQSVSDYLSYPSIDAWANLSTLYVTSMHNNQKYKVFTHSVVVTILSIQKEIYTMTNQQNESHSLSKIFENEGFKTVAKAINHCTAYAIYRHNRGDALPYKIHRNLPKKLRNTRNNKEEFIELLWTFLAEYQNETAHVKPKTGIGRDAVFYSDIAQIADLIDKYGTRIIANCLLVASQVRQETNNHNQDIRERNEENNND